MIETKQNEENVKNVSKKTLLNSQVILSPFPPLSISFWLPSANDGNWYLHGIVSSDNVFQQTKSFVTIYRLQQFSTDALRLVELIQLAAAIYWNESEKNERNE